MQTTNNINQTEMTVKRVFSSRRKVVSDPAYITWPGRLFQMRGPAAAKPNRALVGRAGQCHKQAAWCTADATDTVQHASAQQPDIVCEAGHKCRLARTFVTLSKQCKLKTSQADAFSTDCSWQTRWKSGVFVRVPVETIGFHPAGYRINALLSQRKIQRLKGGLTHTPACCQRKDAVASRHPQSRLS